MVHLVGQPKLFEKCPKTPPMHLQFRLHPTLYWLHEKLSICNPKTPKFIESLMGIKGKKLYKNDARETHNHPKQPQKSPLSHRQSYVSIFFFLCVDHPHQPNKNLFLSSTFNETNNFNIKFRNWMCTLNFCSLIPVVFIFAPMMSSIVGT